MRKTIRFVAAGLAVGLLSASLGAQAQQQGQGGRQTAPVPAPAPAIDRAALEIIVQRAVQGAVDRASADAIDRLQKSPALADAAALRQKIEDLDRLRTEVRSEVAALRSTLVSYLIWAAVGFFVLMVLASVLGGAIVAMVFKGRAARA
jgi:hypothetical protein